MKQFRVIYIAKQYPQLSETYIKSEIEALSEECDILVLAQVQAALPYVNHAPYRVMTDTDEIVAAIQAFRPDVLHAHWLYNVWTMARLSERTGVPFTIRAHSFDVLLPPDKNLPNAAPLINADSCLGILTFPFGRDPLESIGIRGEKLHDCYPVVNYERFYDPSPNGEEIMNVGACIPKKNMETFVDLALAFPSTRLNLYAMGYEFEKMKLYNESTGGRVNVIPHIEPEDMPREYKKHRWLVYTASKQIGTVGWPMAIAEAQASGVGVCMANLRPDVGEYVGDAGFVFDSVAQLVDIISKPFPEEMRQRGFEHARKSDVFAHKRILTNLWRGVVTSEAVVEAATTAQSGNQSNEACLRSMC